jgi:toxin ParE1/3/4
MEITLALSAVADLEDIQSYYHDQGVPQVGRQFVTDIIAHIQTLMVYPEIGRMVPEFSKHYIRELIHPPFRVVYLFEPERIQVIRIWRSERLLRLED